MTKHTAYLLLSLLLTACSTYEADLPNADTHTVQLRLAVAADTPTDTRAPGDPGTNTPYKPPRYAYVYYVESISNAVTPLKDLDDNVLAMPLELTDPEVLPNHSGFVTTGDSVYRYTAVPIKMLHDETGKFYVVMSDIKLKYLDGDTRKNLEEKAVSTPEELLNLTFDIDDETRPHLPNIYSTPYNYPVPPYAYPDTEHYYGYKDVLDDVVDLLLYHVAAQVDLKWNVAQTLQPTSKVQTVSVSGLKERNCYLFRPTENTHDASGYSLTLKTADDVAQQWYGRASFYAIPYTDEDHNYDIPLTVNGTDATLRLDMSNANKVFAPWIRVNLTYTDDADFDATLIQPTQQ